MANLRVDHLAKSEQEFHMSDHMSKQSTKMYSQSFALGQLCMQELLILINYVHR